MVGRKPGMIFIDLFTTQQGPHDLRTGQEPCIAFAFVGPGRTNDVFIQRFTAANSDPAETVGEHLGQGGDQMC